jgi:hypothetical protein
MTKKLFIALTFRKKPDMFAHYLLVKEQNNTLGQNRLQVVSFPTKKFYNIDPRAVLKRFCEK